MATWQSTLTANTSTKAGVIELVNKVHAAMTALDCPQTLDTGQLDIANVPDPVLGATTEYGYRIYELNDAQSADLPVFIKIEFVGKRNGPVTSSICETWVSIGFATDGAGGLITPVAEANSPRNVYATGTSTQSTTTNAPCYACKYDGFLFVLVGCGYASWITSAVAANTSGLFFAISRDGEDVALLHAHNTPAAGNPHIAAAEIHHTVISEGMSAVIGPSARTLSAPSQPFAGGAVVATPALLCGPTRSWLELDLVTLPAAAVSPGATVLLSLDDVADIEYLVLPNATSTGSQAGKLDVVADARVRVEFATGVRWE